MACSDSGPKYDVYIGSATGPTKVTGKDLGAIARIEVRGAEDHISGCQITFATGRGCMDAGNDDLIAGNERFHPGKRVVVVARLADREQPVFDGIITQAEYMPSNYPTQSQYHVTCLDLTHLMTVKETARSFPQQDEGSIARAIIGDYSQYGINAEIGKMDYKIRPAETDRKPMQHSDDRAHLMKLAARFGFKFYLEPGPTPKQSTAYWGPSKRDGPSQVALTIDMAPHTNVHSIRFQYNGLAPAHVDDRLQTRLADEQVNRKKQTSDIKTLAKKSGLDLPDYMLQSKFLEAPWGLDDAMAQAQAQGIVDHSLENTITASGEVITSIYGDVLMPFHQVDVRGSGDTYNGIYHVTDVTHRFQGNSYTQQFTLAREGPGGTKSTVNVPPSASA